MPGRLLQLPNRRQQEESDCLAACAAMMLDAINITFPYGKLLAILNVSPWGTPHRNITRLVELVPKIRVVYRQGELQDMSQLRLTLYYEASAALQEVGASNKWCWNREEIEAFIEFIEASPATAAITGKDPHHVLIEWSLV